MEDSHITLPELQGSSLSLFGVFDGHGGREVAFFCRDHVPEEVSRLLQLTPGAASSTSPPRPTLDPALLGESLKGAFHSVDRLLEKEEYAGEVRGHKEQDGRGGNLQQAQDALKANVQESLNQAKDKGALSREDAMQLLMKMNVLKRFESQEQQGAAADNVGCTAVCVLISGSHYVCANAGDSRAVLCRAGRAVELSYDHKPNDATERRRIEAAGGTIEETPVGTGPHARINYRINGNLNLSRSIGDLQYKKRTDLPQEEQMICSTPDIIVKQRSADDEFLVIACDGIWDVKTNQQACDFVKARLDIKMPLHEIVEELLNSCIAVDPKATFGLGGDNMTCIVVKVKGEGASSKGHAAEDIQPAVELNLSKQDSEAKQPTGCFPFRCLRT